MAFWCMLSSSTHTLSLLYLHFLYLQRRFSSHVFLLLDLSSNTFREEQFFVFFFFADLRFEKLCLEDGSLSGDAGSQEAVWCSFDAFCCLQWLFFDRKSGLNTESPDKSIYETANTGRGFSNKQQSTWETRQDDQPKEETPHWEQEPRAGNSRASSTRKDTQANSIENLPSKISLVRETQSKISFLLFLCTVCLEWGRQRVPPAVFCLDSLSKWPRLCTLNQRVNHSVLL